MILLPRQACSFPTDADRPRPDGRDVLLKFPKAASQCSLVERLPRVMEPLRKLIAGPRQACDLEQLCEIIRVIDRTSSSKRARTWMPFVLLMSGCASTPAPHEAAAALTSPTGAAKAAGPITAPGFGRSSVRLYAENYPSRARREGITGRVGLECSVDTRGYVHDIVVLESAGPILDDAAKTLFSDARLLVPPDWAAIGGPAARFRYGVIFRMVGKPEVPPFEDKRQTVVITSSAF